MADPTGFVWQPFVLGENVVANSDNFQAWVGVSTADDAKDYIHLFQARTDLRCRKKYAVVVPPNDDAIEGMRAAGRGSGGLGAFDFRYAVTFGFLQEVSEYCRDNAIDFLNQVGLFLDDILKDDLFSNALRFHQTPYGVEPLKWADGEYRGYQSYWTIACGI